MDFRTLLGEPIGQSSLQLAELSLASILSASIGAARGLGQDISVPEETVGDNWTPPPKGIVTLRVEVRGAKSVARLAERLSEIDGVTSVQIADGNFVTD